MIACKCGKEIKTPPTHDEFMGAYSEHVQNLLDKHFAGLVAGTKIPGIAAKTQIEIFGVYSAAKKNK